MVAAGEYGLGAVQIRQLAVNTNFVFRLTDEDGRRFALRVQRPGLHDAADTEMELWWLSQLAQAGLPVAAVVPAPDGRTLITVDGVDGIDEPHQAVLFEWLPGDEPDDEDLEFWAPMGMLAARLHEHSTGLVVPNHLPLRRWDSVFAYEEPVLFDAQHAAIVDPEMRRTLEQGIERLDAELASRYTDVRSPGSLSPGDRSPMLVHGDLHNGNVRRHRGKLSVFDFEDLIVGHPDHDLAVMLYGSYYNHPEYESVLAEAKRGYETVRPWPLDDDAALHPLFAARALGLINYCLVLGEEYRDFISVLAERVRRYLAT